MLREVVIETGQMPLTELCALWAALTAKLIGRLEAVADTRHTERQTDPPEELDLARTLLRRLLYRLQLTVASNRRHKCAQASRGEPSRGAHVLDQLKWVLDENGLTDDQLHELALDIQAISRDWRQP